MLLISTRMQSRGWRRCGLGVDSAQQIIAEVGPTATNFLPRNVSPLGWSCPGDDDERGRELQPPISERQPPHASRSQPNGQRRSQDQRKHLRDCVSPAASRAWDIIKPSGRLPIDSVD